MTDSENTFVVRLTQRFDAQADPIYDAFLDPEKARQFLFATATGQIVRCEIDARVGGTFAIIDRRHGEDVAHTGTYIELDRPRRIGFTLSIEKYSEEVTTVTIDITPLARGCELTLTHEMKAEHASASDRTRTGWAEILDVAATLLVDDTPTCGVGVAQHARIPATIGVMFEGLAETLELHREMLPRDEANARLEDEVYRQLAESWSRIAKLVQDTAARMERQRELPMAAHDESAWGDAHVHAFAKVVTSQSHLLALLRVAAARDEQMLASMRTSAGA